MWLTQPQPKQMNIRSSQGYYARPNINFDMLCPVIIDKQQHLYAAQKRNVLLIIYYQFCYLTGLLYRDCMLASKAVTCFSVA
jgi:hypothetical protein